MVEKPQDPREPTAKDLEEDAAEKEWQYWDELYCENRLQSDPQDNAAKFRLAEIYFQREENLDKAKKYIKSILHSNEEFMECETYEMLGDILFMEAEMDKENIDLYKAVLFYF